MDTLTCCHTLLACWLLYVKDTRGSGAIAGVALVIVRGGGRSVQEASGM